MLSRSLFSLFKCKDSARRMQSSLLVLLSRSLFSLFKCKVTTIETINFHRWRQTEANGAKMR